MKATWICVGMCLAGAGVAFAQPENSTAASDTIVAQAIDQNVTSLHVQSLAISDALSDLGAQVGVKMTIDQASLDLLPWGDRTKLAELSVTDASLRQILPRVLDVLGMTYEVGRDGILVSAGEPLKRMNRRATWDDLKLLQLANELEFTPTNFEQFKLQYRITSKVDAAGMLTHQLGRSGQGTVAQMLEVATGSLGWVWFPNGDHIVIRTGQAQIANKLSRRITVAYPNEPLANILMDLANRAETAFVLEPGMMLKLPQATVKEYTLLLQETSIRQALELICAQTGLKYEIDREIVRIGLSEALAEGGAAASSQRMPYVGKISVPAADGSYSLEFLIRSEDLPPDILDARKEMIEEVVQKMRRELGPTEPIQSPDAPDH